jgi:D-lyxose ketol-isomerase
VKAGHVFRLKPGDSITLTPYLYHEFWAEEGSGTSIVGEVSSVNDDDSDNAFYGKVGRFPTIEEDVPVTHKLCTEY